MIDKIKNNMLIQLPFSDALAGAASGIFIGILLQPLEIIKVCLIVNPMHLATIEKANFIASFVSSVRLIYQMEGLKGFWRGLFPALLRMASGSAVYFEALNRLNLKFKNLEFTGPKSDFLSSGIARIASTIICNPLTVVRTRIELVGFNEYNNLFDAIRKIQKQEGLKGFLKGSAACVLRDGPYYTILNLTKKQLVPLNFSNSTNTMTAGMVAGIIATTMSQPFDVLRTRLQVDMPSSKYGYNYGSLYQGLRKIWNDEGITGFGRGLIPRLMKKPLANALTFTIFEFFKDQTHKSNPFH